MSHQPTGTRNYHHYLKHHYAPLKDPIPATDLDPELDEEELLADLDVLADLPADIPTNQPLIAVVQHQDHFHILGHPYLHALISHVREANPHSK